MLQGLADGVSGLAIGADRSGIVVGHRIAELGRMNRFLTIDLRRGIVFNIA